MSKPEYRYTEQEAEGVGLMLALKLLREREAGLPKFGWPEDVAAIRVSEAGVCAFVILQAIEERGGLPSDLRHLASASTPGAPAPTPCNCANIDADECPVHGELTKAYAAATLPDVTPEPTRVCKYCAGRELRSVCVKCGRPPAVAAVTPVGEPAHDWRPLPGTGWECPRCMALKRVYGIGELSQNFEYRRKGARLWQNFAPTCAAEPPGVGR